MSGNKVVLDTNIALYLFRGDQELAHVLQDIEAYLSFINELELLGYQGATTEEMTWINSFWKSVLLWKLIRVSKTLQ